MPKRKDPKEIKLSQPDRSGPTEKTLLQWAEERELFAQAQARERQPASKSKSKAKSTRSKGDTSGSEDRVEGGDKSDGNKSESEEEEDEAVFTPGQERVLEAVLWAATVSTVHFMLDVLVQNQYAMEIDFWRISLRTGQAFLVFLFLLYTLHPHPTANIPLLPPRFHPYLRSLIFFITSCVAGCYLVHTTNTSSHLAIMKRAPTIGCLWLWAVAELDLDLSVASVGVTAGFLFFGGYSIR